MSTETESARCADLYRIGLKLFLEAPGALQLAELVPVFHRWIQTRAVDGLLIDVADYSHVPQGPGVMLVADEGNYALDLGRGRLGLAYWRKRPLDGALPARLAAVCRILLDACRRLEEAPELQGRARFRGEELLLVANDRLRAPNTQATRDAFLPALTELLGKLYGAETCGIEQEADPRELFALRVKAPTPVGTDALRQRLLVD